MRRFVLLVAAVAPLMASTGCEDGPNQPFGPAPNGAASQWNGPPGGATQGDGGATFAGTGTEAYDAGFGGTNANQLCTADEEKSRWGNLFQENIQIPGLAGGIDMAGGPNGDGLSGWSASGNNSNFMFDPTKETWVGATVEEAEAILCQGTADIVYYGVSNTLGWGNGCPSCELSVLYNTQNRIIDEMLFQYGYVGNIVAKSVDGSTTYTIGMNNVPMTATTSSGTTNIILPWTDIATMHMIGNQIYDAIRNTYTPTFPPDTDCFAAGHCQFGNNFTQGGYFYFSSLGLAIFANNTLAPQPAASTPGLISLSVLKILPFSIGNVLMKLDSAGEGPLLTVPNVATSGNTCVYKLGQTFGDFDSQCVQALPAGNPNNTIAEHKLLGAASHGDEYYDFDVVGVDPQFAASSLAPNTVLADKEVPSATDVAYEFQLDQQLLGPIDNDYTNNDPTQPEDLHGLGMITIEMANLVQQYMTTNYGVTSKLGNAACIAAFDANVNAHANGLPLVATPGCSGIEGIVTTAPTALVTGIAGAVNALGVNATAVDPIYTSGLKPQTQYLDFCGVSGDPTTGAGYADCEGGSFGGPLGGFYFDSIQWAVQSSFGPNPVPSPLSSRSWYFEQFILASIKYFQTAANPAATLAMIDANAIDPNEVFFDAAGGGFENGNYIFRNTVNSATQAPTFLNVATNLTTSVLNNWTFARYNFRGDQALYTTLTTVPTDQPGAEPIYLSNLAGAPVLTGAYGGLYECAIDITGTDPNCSGVPAPVDGYGNPLYAPYKGAFGATVFNIAANGSAPTASAMTVDPTDFELLQSAMVTLPIWSNPYDPTTAMPGTDKTVSVLLPYLPKGASVGFPVTVDGSRDKFYNTNSLVFTSQENLAGTTFDSVVDYEYTAVSGMDGGTQNILVVRAIETQSYLGLLFACAEPSTTVPGATDILSVRMFDYGTDILAWIAAHPKAVADCGIQIKYSIYGNYPDYISALSNGVRFGLNSVFGNSVVADGTLFDPNVVATLGQ